MCQRSAELGAKVKVLREYVRHHVRGEENTIFPSARPGGSTKRGRRARWRRFI